MTYTETRVIAIIKELWETIPEVTLDSTLQSLGITDDIDLVELLFAVEDEFIIEVEDGKEYEWKTVADVVADVNDSPIRIPVGSPDGPPHIEIIRQKPSGKPNIFTAGLITIGIQILFMCGAALETWFDHAVMHVPRATFDSNFTGIAIFFLTLWMVHQWRK